LDRRRLILGSVQSGGNNSFYTSDSTAFKGVLRHAIKSGIRSFDTAYSYADAETMLSAILKEQHIQREEIFLIDKIMPLVTLRKKAEISLKRLNTEYLDVLLLHWPTGDEKLLFEALKTLEKLKEEKKAKEIGVSNFPLELIDKVRKDFDITSIERPLSLIWAKDIDKTLALGLKVYGYAPLGFGLLSGKYHKKEDFSDNRRSLWCLGTPEFLSLLEEVRRIAEEKETQMVNIALSWALNQKAEGIIVGARDKNQLEQLLSIPQLSNEDMLCLQEKAERVSNTNISDNPYNHRWQDA